MGRVRVRVDVGRQVGLFVGLLAALALSLFLPAGTVAWPVGWIFLGLFLAVTIWLSRHNPGLLAERTRLRASDQQGWDKALFPLLLVSPCGWLILTALDAVRLRWTPVPLWLQPVGAIALLGSFALLFLTFRENAYLSPVVRIQGERGH